MGEDEAALCMMLQPAVKLVYLTTADFPHIVQVKLCFL